MGKQNKQTQETQSDNHGIILNGVITEALKDATFSVQLETGSMALCRICGKMRKFFIRVTPGDSVTVELSPYDLTKGRILRRQ